jgi:transcriptional regulator with XRE-family HTH domain
MQNEKDESLELNKKSHSSVSDLMHDLGDTEEDVKRVKHLVNRTRIATGLAKLRLRKGLTQNDMAKALGVTQGTISKIENGPDDELTVKILGDYYRAVDAVVIIQFGPPMTLVERIRHHLEEIKNLLDQLARLANKYEELGPHIAKFFSDSLSVILDTWVTVGNRLPKRSEAPETPEWKLVDSAPARTTNAEAKALATCP